MRDLAYSMKQEAFKRMSSNIRDLSEKVEQKRYLVNGLAESNNDLQVCIINRQSSGFDKRVLAGHNIMTYNLDYGVMGNRTSRQKFINFVDKGLKHKTAELKAADVTMSLKNHDGSISLSQELLESECIYVFDFLNILRTSDQIIDHNAYFGWGILKIDWNKNAHSVGKNWVTGIPVIIVKDPRNIFVSPSTKSDNLCGNDNIFELDSYRTEELKKLLIAKGKKNIANQITASISHIVDSDVNRENQASLSESFKEIDICTQQYSQAFVNQERSIVNNDDGTIKSWVEADYQVFLKEVYDELVKSDSLELYFLQVEGIIEADTKLSEEEQQFEHAEELTELLDAYQLGKDKEKKALEILDILAQENESNAVFPEKVVATKKREVIRRYWFETKFVPQLNLTVQEPLILDTCTYSFYTAGGDLDYPYPISTAFKHSNLLEIYNVLLTKQILYSQKFDKPQIVIIPGAISNESEFREAGFNPNFAVLETPGWRQHGKFPADQKPFYYIYPQEVGRMADIIEGKLERAIDGGLRSTPAVRGESSFAGESGKSIVQKTINAKQGDKTDIFKLSEFYKSVYEILKWMIARKKDGIPHETSHLNDNNERDMIDVNTNDTNQLIDSIDSTFVEVSVLDDVDALSIQRKNEALLLLERGLATKIDTLREINPPNVEAKIKNLKNADIGIQLQEAIGELPEEEQQNIIQQILQLKENSEAKKE